MKGLSIPIFLAGLALAPLPAAASNPDAAALINQARDASVKGENALALRMAQAAIVADPAHPAPYVALGELYARQGQDDYARSYYAAALQIDPQDASALRAMAALSIPAQAASVTP